MLFSQVNFFNIFANKFVCNRLMRRTSQLQTIVITPHVSVANNKNESKKQNKNKTSLNLRKECI
jgi:hypothetical protein